MKIEMQKIAVAVAHCFNDEIQHYAGLTEYEQVVAFIKMENEYGEPICPNSKRIARHLEMELPKVKTILKQLVQANYIECIPVFSYSDGLLAGKGYRLKD